MATVTVPSSTWPAASSSSQWTRRGLGASIAAAEDELCDSILGALGAKAAEPSRELVAKRSLAGSKARVALARRRAQALRRAA